MIVRVVKQHRGIGRVETDYPCSSICKVYWDDGIDLILYDVGGDPTKEVKVEMPRDGKRIFIMNDSGDTTDSISWPVGARDRGKKDDKKSVKEEDTSAEVSNEPQLRVMV